MNDPHVVALIYNVEHPEGINFDEAEPLEFETSQFTVRVEEGAARFDLKMHFSKAEEARATIEPFIRVWETWDALNPLLTGFKLVYATSEVIDRNPPPGNYGHQVLPSLYQSGIGGFPDDGSRNYPVPTTEQAAMNAEVEVMAYRYWLYRQGRDRLAAMAYFCLSVLEISSQHNGSRREQAAARYRVDRSVLNEIGRLTAFKGGREARKGQGIEQSFTEHERMWLERKIKVLIRRVADIAEDPDQDLPLITMN